MQNKTSAALRNVLGKKLKRREIQSSRVFHGTSLSGRKTRAENFHFNPVGKISLKIENEFQPNFIYIYIYIKSHNFVFTLLFYSRFKRFTNRITLDPEG